MGVIMRSYLPKDSLIIDEFYRGYYKDEMCDARWFEWGDGLISFVVHLNNGELAYASHPEDSESIYFAKFFPLKIVN